MKTILENGWIACFIFAYLIQVLVPMSINNKNNIDKVRIFLKFIAWVLSVIGFIMFIVWLTRFNNIKVLNKMWIISLITWIVSIGILIFMSGTESKILLIPGYLLGYSFTIFLGTLITFLVKNK